MPIRILLAVDDPLVASLLEERLSREDDLELAGVAGNPELLVEGVRRARAQLLVIDLLPGLHKLRNAIESVARRAHAPLILAIGATGREETEEEQAELFRWGVNGYLPRSRSHELLEAIRTVAAGEVWLTAPVSQRLIQEHQTLVRNSRGDGSDRLAQLTPRERDVLYQVGRGLTNVQAADALGMSVNTVKLHLRNILRKLGLPSRVEAAVLALQEGLLEERR